MKKLSQLLLVFLIFSILSCANTKSEIKSATHQAVIDSFALDQPLPFDPTIIKGQLANGLTYLIKQNRKPEKRLFLRLIVKVGSIVEEDNEQGIAHFCEHMAFNGTKHFKKQELVDFLESIGMRFGADLNAYTSFDQTVYMLEVPTDSLPLVEKAIQILEDWAHNVTFDPEEIDKERGVVIEEWRLGRGAFQRIRDKVLPDILKDSRYAKRLPIGKKEILESFPHQVPINFYKKWYRPELMAVVIVGDYDPQVIKRLVVEHFQPLQNPPNAPKRKYYPVPAQNQTIISTAQDPELPVAQIEIDYKSNPDTEKVIADYRKSIMQNMVAQMLSQRLSEYTSKPNPPFNFAYSYMGRLVQTKEVFTLACAARPEDILTGYKTLLMEAKRALQFGFTPSELKRQKESLISYLEKVYRERDKQNSKKLIDEYVRHVLYLEPVPGIENEFKMVKRLLKGIEIGEINQLARRLLENNDRVIVVSGPQKEGIYFPPKDTLKAILAQTAQMQLKPYVDQAVAEQLLDHPIKAGKVVAEQNYPELGILDWKLSNGARVLLKATNFKNDEILMSGISFGGFSLAPDSIYWSAKFASSIAAASGIGKLDIVALRKFLADKVLRFQAGISKDTEEISGSSSVKDFETLLQMVYLNFKEPRFDRKAFSSFITRQKSWLKTARLDPQNIYQDSLTVWLTQYNPRYLPLNEEMLDQIKLASAARFYHQRFANPGDFTFIFVGSFEPSQIKPLIEKYIGGMPGHEENESWGFQDYTPPENVVVKKLYKGMNPKSINTIIFNGPFSWSYENVRKALFVTNILQIRLRERIREEKSGTYSISVRGKYYHIPRQRYEVIISFSCKPERVDELTKEVFNQVDSLIQFGPSAKNLEKVREMYLKEYEEGLKQNNFWKSRIYYSLFHHLPFNSILELDDIYQSITRQDVHEMAKQLLNKQRYLRAVLYPEKQ